jgi:Domain of unknown function (DUF5134)
MTPRWILDIFAALMLVVAAVSAARLVAARPWQRGAVIVDTDITHLLMAIAMARMLAPSLTTLPAGAWEVIFALMIAWFAYRVLRDARANGMRALAGGHCAPHLVHSAAMLYMFAAVAAPAAGGSGMSGMGGSSGHVMQTLSYPTLTFLFALILVGYSIWDLDHLPGLRHGVTAAVAGVPGVALAGVLAGGGAETAASFTGLAAEAGPSADWRPSPAVAGQPVVGPAAAGSRSALEEALLSPGVTVACRIAMGVTMALMLIIMI